MGFKWFQHDRKAQILALPIMAAVTLWITTSGQFSERRRNAVDGEAKALLQSLGYAMKSMKIELKRYPTSLREAGFQTDGMADADIFLHSQDMPNEISRTLPKEALPFVDKESFRAIIVIRRGGRIATVWQMDENWKPEKVMIVEKDR